jgi:hypothetical protein
MSALAKLRADKRVLHVDDERNIGNSIIVTMVDGRTLTPSDPHDGVFGADTASEAWQTLRRSVKYVAQVSA